MKYSGNSFCLLMLAVVLVTPAAGQVEPDEHAKHHPAPGGASPAPSSQAAPAGLPMSGGRNRAQTAAGNTGGNQPNTASGSTNPAPAPGAMGGNQPAGAGGGGMGAGMGEMMKEMGKPPPKELYPLLMDWPDLPPEQQAEVEQLAHERMKAGAALLSSGVETLAESTAKDDYSAMQQAAEHMRQGLAQFESGLAARQALVEGKVTRNVALQWFKHEMNLASPIRPDEPRAVLGVTPFHLFTMGLLIAFAFAMVVMYFFKMRRAEALFGRLDPDTQPPPPGASPPLAGGKPPDGKKPASDKPAAPATQAAAPADKPAAPADKAAADAPLKGNGPAPSAPAQERPAATKFECLAPTAREVFLAGTFNGWDTKATPMIKDAQGNWNVDVPLSPGRHEFKFVVDGVFCCEPGCEAPYQGCPKCVPNSSGTMNRVLEVS